MKASRIFFIAIIVAVLGYTGLQVLGEPLSALLNRNQVQDVSDPETRYPDVDSLLQAVEESLNGLTGAAYTMEVSLTPLGGSSARPVLVTTRVLARHPDCYRITSDKMEIGAGRNHVWLYTKDDRSLIQLPKDALDPALWQTGSMADVNRYRQLAAGGEVSLFADGDPIVLTINTDTGWYTMKIDRSTMLPVFQEAAENDSVLRISLTDVQTDGAFTDADFDPPTDAYSVEMPWLLYAFLADQALLTQQPDQALSAINRALETVPEDDAALRCSYLIRKGNIEKAGGSFSRALEAYAQAGAAAPDEAGRATALFYQGVCLHEQGEYAEAAAKLNEALSGPAFEQAGLAYYYLGSAHYELQNMTEAEKAFEQARDSAPDDGTKAAAELWLSDIRR